MTGSSPIIAHNSFFKGNFCLEISQLKKNWQPAATMLSDAALTTYVKNFINFSMKYLTEKGYYPTYLIVDEYSDEQSGKFSWQPGLQSVMRSEIMAAWLASNLPAKPEYKSLTYLCDNHGKA
jgi:hypothetical protein